MARRVVTHRYTRVYSNVSDRVVRDVTGNAWSDTSWLARLLHPLLALSLAPGRGPRVLDAAGVFGTSQITHVCPACNRTGTRWRHRDQWCACRSVSAKGCVPFFGMAFDGGDFCHGVIYYAEAFKC